MQLVAQYGQFATNHRRLAATLSKSPDKQAHSDDAGTWLLSMPPTPRQTRLAIAAAAIPVIALAVFAPFGSIRLAQVNSFIPAFEGTIFVTDLLTSVLLFSQFSIYRSRALLVLACGYLFSAVTLVAHGLTFPGAFSPGGLLGAGLQSTAWIYWFWHFGFPLSLLTYGLLKDEKPEKRLSDVPGPFVIGGSAALVIAFACSLILLATAGNDFMPRLALDRVHIAPVNQVVGAASMLLCASALAVLWFRRRSVLDQWLMVVAVAALCELGLAVIFVGGRYTIGFYAGRIFTFLTSTIVLVVLLVETTRLYARLARTNMMLKREQDNRMMSLEAMTASIAHEVRQPLTALLGNAAAARNLLRRAPPNLGKAESLMSTAIDAGYRVSEVFDNIRDLCRQTNWPTETVDLNEVIQSVLGAQVEECMRLQVETRISLGPTPLYVAGHRGQLHEVIDNLVRNAIEAMSAVNDGARVLQVQAERRDDTITVIVQDSGPGFSENTLNKIFDAFFTVKPGGMGLGLAICRLIIERHRGEISAAQAQPRGAVLCVVLPALGS